MKANEKISVIVPVYNVKLYLHKCVDSILNQTYQNIEVLLIDDGSTDGSSDICDSYTEKDSRIKVVHKKNGGLSSARNTGLDMATGEYILFVDSDDYIDIEMIRRLYDALVKTGADMSVCNIRMVGVDGLTTFPYPENVVRDEEMDEALYWRKVYEPNAICYVVAWNKLYQKHIWEKNRYPVGKLNEDEYVLHQILQKCRKITGISYVGYNYVIREDSIMSQKGKKANFDVFDGWMERIVYLKSSNQYEKVQKQLSVYCVELINRYHSCRTRQEKERFREYYHKYKVLYEEAKSRSRMQLKEILKTFGCERMPGLMNFIVRGMFRHQGVR